MAGILENPPVLQQPFAYNGDKNTIPLNATGDQRASLQEGFPPITSVKITEGGIPPERKDFNGLGNLLSSLYFYLQNGGQFTFNQQVSDAIGGYPAGAILTYTDSVTHISYNVVSLINNNTFNFVAEPSYIDGVKWAKTYTDDLSNYVQKTGDETISGTKTFENDIIAPNVVKIGSLLPFAGDTPPSGWLRCDGSRISRITYANLFAVIGTKYGVGDGSTTFNLPNFINRTFWGGATSGAYLSGTLPNIKGVTGPNGCYHNYYKGCFYNAGGKYDSPNGSNRFPEGVGFDASLSSSKYQDGALVRPESIQTMILIKY